MSDEKKYMSPEDLEQISGGAGTRPACPDCGSGNVVPLVKRDPKTGKQLYACKACGHNFPKD